MFAKSKHTPGLERGVGGLENTQLDIANVHARNNVIDEEIGSVFVLEY